MIILSCSSSIKANIKLYIIVLFLITTTKALLFALYLESNPSASLCTTSKSISGCTSNTLVNPNTLVCTLNLIYHI